MPSSEHESLVPNIRPRVTTYTIAEAIAKCAASSTTANALIDVSNRTVLKSFGFDDWLPLRRALLLTDLNGLILPFFYPFVLGYFRSAREILSNGKDLRLRGSYLRITFPSKVCYGQSKALLCVTSEPCILDFGRGDERMGAINSFEIVGIYQDDFFPVMPMVRVGRTELEEESFAVMELAAPFIYEKIQLFTIAEWDVLQYLAKGRSDIELAAILRITVSTVLTHRRNISQKIKAHFPDLNDRKLANRLVEQKLL